MKEKEKLFEHISMGSLGLGAFLFFFRTDFILKIVGLVLVFLIAPSALILSHYIGKKSKEEEDELWLGRRPHAGSYASVGGISGSSGCR